MMTEQERREAVDALAEAQARADATGAPAYVHHRSEDGRSTWKVSTERIAGEAWVLATIRRPSRPAGLFDGAAEEKQGQGGLF